MVRCKNFAGQQTPKIKDTEYVRCNFAQRAPIDDHGGRVGVRLFPGDKTPRTFRNCLMVNCEPPPGSKCVDCVLVLVEYDQEVDLLDTTKKGLILYGHYDPVAEQYERLGAPRKIGQPYLNAEEARL